jgi:hypothetical protein
MIAPGPHHSGELWMTFSSWVEQSGRTEADDAELLGLTLRRLHDALAAFSRRAGWDAGHSASGRRRVSWAPHGGPGRL